MHLCENNYVLEEFKSVLDIPKITLFPNKNETVRQQLRINFPF